MFFKLILTYCLILNFALSDKIPLCKLPTDCRLQKVNKFIYANGVEKLNSKDTRGLFCEVKESFSFDFNLAEIPNCSINLNDGETKVEPIIELQWPNHGKKPTLTKSNIHNLFSFIYSLNSFYYLNLININQFEYNIFDDFFIDDYRIMNIHRLYCINCKFDISFNQTVLKTCEDFSRFNLTQIRSIFHIYEYGYIKINGNFTMKKLAINYTIVDGDFQQPFCPLVFNDSYIGMFQLIGLIDSFYKRNLLSFSNHTFENFISRIERLELDLVHNINLDYDFLNPDVFKNVKTIYVYGSINRIEESIFKTFHSLSLISFKTNNFRKMMHRNGINWIKAINSNVSFDLRNYKAMNISLIKVINLDCYYYSQEESLASVFPDRDFCLYVDYPFSQLVLLTQLCGTDEDDLKYLVPIDFSCTLLWLIQYYKSYYDNYIYSYYFINYYGLPINIINLDQNLIRFFASPNFKPDMSKCNFTLMKSLCDKSEYKVSDISGFYNYSTMNKKFETAFKISSYLFSFFGIISNLIVIVTIQNKDNVDLFKGIKQYDYLCYNSIFSMLILVIQLFSWMSECFYPYEVFCPEIRKLVFVQVFKMVFKECFVTAFRFMWSFSYVAFVLNRISLIGKDHGKLVQFMSDVGVKTYLAVCFVISCGFSVIKYFKYEINYDQSETSYPNQRLTEISNNSVIIANSIIDILNYVVFEVIIFIIDIYMVIVLRRILEEKIKRSEHLIGIKDQNILQTMKMEFQDAANKMIKMVILNTAISVLFKLPISFIPVLDVIAEFYYKDYFNLFFYPKFADFYSFLIDSGFYDFLVNCSDMLFTLSLVIQLFIYIYFDKKFKMAIHRIPKKSQKN